MGKNNTDIKVDVKPNAHTTMSLTQKWGTDIGFTFLLPTWIFLDNNSLFWFDLNIFQNSWLSPKQIVRIQKKWRDE